MEADMEFRSVEDLRDHWLQGSELPFQPLAIAGSTSRLLFRVAPETVVAAEAFLNSHRLVVNGRTVATSVAIHPHTEPGVHAGLHERLIGAPVEDARVMLSGLGWSVHVIAAGQVATGEHRPSRLNLVSSDEGVVTGVFVG
jgi:hypothetical protein